MKYRVIFFIFRINFSYKQANKCYVDHNIFLAKTLFWVINENLCDKNSIIDV